MKFFVTDTVFYEMVHTKFIKWLNKLVSFSSNVKYLNKNSYCLHVLSKFQIFKLIKLILLLFRKYSLKSVTKQWVEIVETIQLYL